MESQRGSLCATPPSEKRSSSSRALYKSHTRRKSYDLYHATASPVALEALERIAALFAIESTIRGRPPDQRVAAREEHARPLLEQQKAFLDTSLSTG